MRWKKEENWMDWEEFQVRKNFHEELKALQFFNYLRCHVE